MRAIPFTSNYRSYMMVKDIELRVKIKTVLPILDLKNRDLRFPTCDIITG